MTQKRSEVFIQAAQLGVPNPPPVKCISSLEEFNVELYKERAGRGMVQMRFVGSNEIETPTTHGNQELIVFFNFTSSFISLY